MCWARAPCGGDIIYPPDMAATSPVARTRAKVTHISETRRLIESLSYQTVVQNRLEQRTGAILPSAGHCDDSRTKFGSAKSPATYCDDPLDGPKSYGEQKRTR